MKFFYRWVVDFARIFLIRSRRSCRKTSGMGEWSTSSKNSPGILRLLPYRSSAVEHLISSLYAVRNSNSTVGNHLIQLFSCWSWHMSAAFKILCHRSTIPLDDDVLVRLQPSKLINFLKSSASNIASLGQLLLSSMRQTLQSTSSRIL